VLSLARELIPAPLFAPTSKAALRFAEFFTARINNDNTRKAYLNATRRFALWSEERGITGLEDVQAIHVAAFVRDLQQELSPPTVKQHLAALRMLFDWLVTGQVIPINPAHSVRGPKHVVKKGKTPVLRAEEAKAVLSSIDVATAIGLRDRALIGVMVYSFARIGAVLKMKVRDYFVQGRRGWIRLHEKGGKEHDVPCHHSLEAYLDEYIKGAGLAERKDGFLFPTMDRKTGGVTSNPMWQQDAYRMIQRRAKAAGVRTHIGNHTFRATGITAYLSNGGQLEIAQQIAAHESPRTTKLYDRRRDDISLDEIERIVL
jgi:site-specific recombinase XerD